jgi:micrococcal nuclease
MKMPKTRYLIFFFLLVLLLIRFVPEIGVDHSPADRFKVIHIIDGDTAELSGGDRLRLLAIDTPEKQEPFYDSAKYLLASLTAGKEVEIAYSKRRRDGYGRILGHVYVDTLWVNREIIRQGFGYVYLFEDNAGDKDRIGALLKAQEEAIAAKRGIWSVNKEREDFYLGIKGSFRFHRPFCRSLKKHKQDDLIKFGSREEAFNQGYSPCRNCRP